jgi:hypothetical protein
MKLIKTDIPSETGTLEVFRHLQERMVQIIFTAINCEAAEVVNNVVNGLRNTSEANKEMQAYILQITSDIKSRGYVSCKELTKIHGIYEKHESRFECALWEMAEGRRKEIQLTDEYKVFFTCNRGRVEKRRGKEPLVITVDEGLRYGDGVGVLFSVFLTAMKEALQTAPDITTKK